MQSYLDIAKQALRQHRDLTQYGETKGTKNEFNETSEISRECLACLCDTYIIRLGDSCTDCRDELCARCGGCLRASLIWRRAQIDQQHKDVPVSQLLERLQKGSQWLREQDKLYFDGNHEEAARANLFNKMWALWSDLELALRHIHSYRGCVFGDGQCCPADGPVTCETCHGQRGSQRHE